MIQVKETLAIWDSSNPPTPVRIYEFLHKNKLALGNIHLELTHPDEDDPFNITLAFVYFRWETAEEVQERKDKAKLEVDRAREFELAQLRLLMNKYPPEVRGF